MKPLEQACLPYLAQPIEQTTFGEAFKGFLQFRQEIVFDWAKADDVFVYIELEYSKPERVQGFLGILGMTKPAQPKTLIVALERIISSIANDDEISDDTEEQEQIVALELEYDFADLMGIDPDIINENFYDSSEHQTLEDFVQAVLADDTLQKVALLCPKSVELSAADD